jgi:hypothetical protein
MRDMLQNIQDAMQKLGSDGVATDDRRTTWQTVIVVLRSPLDAVT